MTGFAILRALGRPLAALGVVLMLLGTVVPGAAAGTHLCIGAGDGLLPAGLGAPECEACLLVALPATPPSTLPEPEVGKAVPSPVARGGGAGCGPEMARIRDPPAR